MCSLVFVQWIKTFMVVTLVAVWSLASNHCRLELISAFTFAACDEQGTCSGERDKDCETDDCATIEGQPYKTEGAQTSLPAPVLLAVDFVVPLVSENTPLGVVDHFLPDTAPKLLSRLWQFSYRTALPPRAPSLLS